MTASLCEILSPQRIICDNSSKSKKAVLAKICQLFKQSQPQIDEIQLFNDYINRERLGSTAIGSGIAIPHVRTNQVQQGLACLIKINHKIDFGAADQKPVDLVAALIVPEDHIEQHLSTLASIASMFKSTSFCQQLRQTCNDSQLIDTIYQHEEAISA